MPVVDVADLIAMKILADRPTDIKDVFTLLRVQEASVDRARVRHTLQVLESALGQSDLLPTFDQALAQAQSGRR